ncbi:hypothetical protein ACH436_03015 [Isoptericola sp. NPDC019693]|uniref:hypothetical protein n=1 Tax=Isoptericola sp. NPDC019693 TaxID=3364009 RepID=UPI00379BB074
MSMHRDATTVRPLSSRTRHVPSGSTTIASTTIASTLPGTPMSATPMSTPAWCRRR